MLRNTLNVGILVSKLHRLIKKSLFRHMWIHLLLLSGKLCSATARGHQATFCFHPRNGHFLMPSTYSHKPAHLWSLDISDQINLRWRRRIHLLSGPGFAHLAGFLFLSSNRWCKWDPETYLASERARTSLKLWSCFIIKQSIRKMGRQQSDILKNP